MTASSSDRFPDELELSQSPSSKFLRNNTLEDLVKQFGKFQDPVCSSSVGAAEVKSVQSVPLVREVPSHRKWRTGRACGRGSRLSPMDAASCRSAAENRPKQDRPAELSMPRHSMGLP